MRITNRYRTYKRLVFVMKYSFLFDRQLQSTYSAEQYNRQQLAYLADAHRREWLERINAKIASLMSWTTKQELDLRDKYIALRKLVNSASI